MTEKRKPKRKRGGQPGNQNARKHGFYASKLSGEQMEYVLNHLSKGEGYPEAVAVHVKLYTALAENPGNTRVVREAARLLYKIFRNRLGFSDNDAAYFKKVIRRTLQDIVKKVLQNDGTNQSCNGDNISEVTKRIEPEKTEWTILSASEDGQ